MRPGWRIFLRIITAGIYKGAEHAKKPVARQILTEAGELLEQIDDTPTPAQTPKAKQHRGVR